MKILIADDDRLSRKLLEKILQRAGYDVIAVENGRQAADQLCKPDGPRLALLDWMMPELDGPGVCRVVRRNRKLSYVHMILLTSKESKQDVIQGLQSGADDYLIKPCDPEELEARLRTGQRILQLEDKLVEAREDMRFNATHDTLTGLFNRRVILDLLGRELARTQREQGCTSILMGDVDYFKKVNDTYGHMVGDEVLMEIARRLLASVRSYDFVGRYGGEEFLIVLNSCERSFALARAEEIRKSVAQGPVQTSRGLVGVTVSFGVLSSKDWGARTVEDLLRETDAALYSSKAAGRNCCKVAKPNVALQGTVAPPLASPGRTR
jgi:two-component system cell cycle response regulator